MPYLSYLALKAGLVGLGFEASLLCTVLWPQNEIDSKTKVTWSKNQVGFSENVKFCCLDSYQKVS